MQVFTHLNEWQEVRSQISGSLGFVPTMGALHEGHASLVKRSKLENDFTVCSIFVNPLQFDKKEDLQNYPRTFESDQAILESLGCDFLIYPTPETMYPSPVRLKFDFGKLETEMEGRFRTGHFSGVAVVVAKLFHLAQPTRAYFGQKDWQQYLIIRQLAQDLSFPLEVIPCPIIREKDGLAMSSRNLRLTNEQRSIAPKIYEVLQAAQKELKMSHDMQEVEQNALKKLSQIDGFEPEYFSAVDAYTLEPLEKIEVNTEVLLATAVYLRPIRLIDNLICRFNS
ncbi:MAG: pantoate--beta-alanine ligase [Bacteroidota bacterium]